MEGGPTALEERAISSPLSFSLAAIKAIYSVGVKGNLCIDLGRWFVVLTLVVDFIKSFLSFFTEGVEGV